MAGVVVLGGGARARACAAALSAAGHVVERRFALQYGDERPVILGDLPGSARVALQAVEQGRGLLVTAEDAMRPAAMRALLRSRQPGGALAFWWERGQQPAYRCLQRLAQEDCEWSPAFMRLQSFATMPFDAATWAQELRESIALAVRLAGDGGKAHLRWLSLDGLPSPGSAFSFTACFTIGAAQVQILQGAGELLQRRELMLEAGRRRAFIDELGAPALRLARCGANAAPPACRDWWRLSDARDFDPARPQCLAFVAAASDPAVADAEAAFWQRTRLTLDCLQAALQLNLLPRRRTASRRPPNLAHPPLSPTVA